MPPRQKPLADRLWAKVRIAGPDDCWEWHGAVDKNGYGRIQVMTDGKWGTQLVHRVAYKILKGDIPNDLGLCHSCDNPPCCNPVHHFPGTQLDNMADCARKGRTRGGEFNANKTHCPKGHKYTEENTYRNPNKNERACIKCQREANRQFKAKARALKQQELTS